MASNRLQHPAVCFMAPKVPEFSADGPLLKTSVLFCVSPVTSADTNFVKPSLGFLSDGLNYSAPCLSKLFLYQIQAKFSCFSCISVSIYIIPTYPPHLEKHKLPSIPCDYPNKPKQSFPGNSFMHLAIYDWQFWAVVLHATYPNRIVVHVASPSQGERL